ncbi:hypothetical protein [Kaarinaea lacus]
MPNPPASPTTVKIGVFLVDIIDLNEADETFQAELNIVAEWHDPRLAFDPGEAGTDTKLFQGDFQFNEVFAGWWPQLLFVNEIGTGDVNAIQIEVKADGRVLFLQQRDATIETPMKLQRYPFDTQTLVAYMISYGNPEDQVILEVDQQILSESEDFARKFQNVNIAQWNLLNVDLQPFTVTGNFYGPEREAASGLKLLVTMKRQPGSTIWKIIVPIIVLVLVMWAIFWMDIHDLSDRLGVTLTGILTIIAYQWLIEGDMPKVSYFTFMDAILLFSFLYMCCTIVESLIVVSLSRSNHPRSARKIDRTFQWLYPLAYFVGLGLLSMAYGILLSP